METRQTVGSAGRRSQAREGCQGLRVVQQSLVDVSDCIDEVGIKTSNPFSQVLQLLLGQ